MKARRQLNARTQAPPSDDGPHFRETHGQRNGTDSHSQHSGSPNGRKLLDSADPTIVRALVNFMQAGTAGATAAGRRQGSG